MIPSKDSRGANGHTIRNRLHGLDALRATAALIVLLFHVGRNFDGPHWFPAGYVAVDFFFMLSGYVMARTYDEQFHKGLSARTFFVGRYLRLWPVMALGGMIGCIVLLTIEPQEALRVAAVNLMLIPIFTGREPFPLNGPTWSIFFELFANLVHALLLWRLGTRSLAVCIAIMLAVFAYQAHHYGRFSLGTATEAFAGGFSRVLLSYGIGILLFRIWKDEPPIRISPAVALLSMPVAVRVVGALPSTFDPIGQFVFILVVCPLLLAGGLSLRPGRWAGPAGALSFPLYALHFPIVMMGIRFDWGWISVILVALSAAATVNVITDLYNRSVPRRRLLGLAQSSPNQLPTEQ